MNITLWKWNFDAMFSKDIVNGKDTKQQINDEFG
jgi:ABC-type uncharacterized transport system substrate-binding protein